LTAAAEAGADESGAVRRVRLLPGLTAAVLTVLLLWLAAKVADVLLFFFLAVLIAVYLDALNEFIAARTKLGHKSAFALTIILTLAALAGIGALLVPPLVEQTRQLILRLPDFAIAWKAWLGRLLEQFPALQPLFTTDAQAQVVSTVLDQAQGLVSDLLPKAFSVARGFIDVASTLAMGLYLALHPATYRDFAVSLTPPRHRDATRAVLTSLGRTLRAWVLAQLFTMAVLGALMAIGLRLLNVPYWLTFGIFCGLAAIVPFFGTVISTIVPALFVLGGTGGLVGALLVLLLGVVVHLIEGNIVAPLVMQRGVHLPPVFSIMAVLISGTLLGPLGLLVAVPALCIAMVLVRKVLIARVYGDVATREEARQDVELGLAPAKSPPAKSPSGDAG
jgi:predicted PurR-regulated permease PerM